MYERKNRPVLNFLHITADVLTANSYKNDSLVYHNALQLLDSFFIVVRNKFFRVLEKNSV